MNMRIFHTSGFFFIEGSVMLVVFGGLGILSAAMFPATTGYLERSRDTSRIANLNTVATALGAYYSDREQYPLTKTHGCIPEELNSNYLPKGVPVDPMSYLTPGCDGTNGTYVYRSFTGADNIGSFLLSARLENNKAGNSKKPPFVYTDEELAVGIRLVKGSGPYYIMTR